MKIVICGSLDFKKEMLYYKEELEKVGHEVEIPEGAYSSRSKAEFDKLSLSNPNYFRERKSYYLKKHLEKIDRPDTDAILVLNLDKKNIKGYVGGNTLIEMGFAFYKGKKIYLLKDIDHTHPYYQEILGINPIIINFDLEKIY